MQELASVKAHTLTILRSESDTLRAQLARVEAWDGKISGFETEMRRIETGGDEREIADLRAEREAVENEIRELEERLLGLRAREGHLGRRLEEASNRREAELSSFREGKRGVEEEVKRFLGRPPKLDVVLSVITENEREEPGGEGMMFLTLPPKRRTLAMARDWLTFCLSSVSSHVASTETEKGALEEGALMWESTIDLVTNFENELRAQMKERRELGAEDVKGQLQKMGKIIETLEGTASVTEGRGWNLLICAVGAELEAFKEGRGILRSIIGEPFSIEKDDHGDQKGSSILINSGLTREPLANTATEISNGNGSNRDHDIPSSVEFSTDIRNPDHTHDANPDRAPPIVLDGLQTTSSLRNYTEDDEELPTPTAPQHRESIGVGHARSVSQIYSQSPGQSLLQSHSLRDREPSPYRSESEDDGPPAALLVGLQDEDYE
jgi:archaellum component FlaC